MPLSPRTSLLSAGLGVLAQGDTQANVDCTATTEPTATVIATAPAVALDGATPVVVAFSFTAWGQNSTTAQCRLVLFDAVDGAGAVSLGRIWTGRAYTAILSSVVGSWPKYRLTPAAGSHVFSVRGWVSAASTFRIGAGAGGPGVDMPAQLRVLAA